MKHIDHLSKLVELEVKSSKAVGEALEMAARMIKDAKDSATAQLSQAEANCEECSKREVV